VVVWSEAEHNYEVITMKIYHLIGLIVGAVLIIAALMPSYEEVVLGSIEHDCKVLLDAVVTDTDAYEYDLKCGHTGIYY
jgi:hypothetical protein